MSTSTIDRPLHVLIIRERGCFLAQCIDYDIAAHGDSVEEAKQRLVKTLMVHHDVAQRRGREPFEGLPAAPRQYRDRWHAERNQREPESLEVRSSGQHSPYFAEAIVAD